VRSDNLSQIRGGSLNSPAVVQVGDELDDYVRETARNLVQFALRRGMSKERFLKLVKEGME
jgi:hypothetical protein